jgi:hypothetical protein
VIGDHEKVKPNKLKVPRLGTWLRNFTNHLFITGLYVKTYNIGEIE